MSDNANKIDLEQKWSEKFPSTLVGLFAFYQCLCTIAIIGCEIGSVLIDLFNATIYVGFWASLFLIIAWISQAVSVTCDHTRKCAKYTLIIQCIALFFAACVIGFDAYFLIDPTVCFVQFTLCNSTAPIRGVYYSEDNFNNIKIPLIKGQLAVAAIMFAFCIDYIIIYVVICNQMKKSIQSISKPATNNPIDIVVTTPIDTRVLTTDETKFNTSVSSMPITKRNISASTVTTGRPLSAKSMHQSRWSIDSNDTNPTKIKINTYL